MFAPSQGLNNETFIGGKEMTRKRVKCANCGTIYDIKPVGDMIMVMSSENCPKCKSNAYDIISIGTEWKRVY